jgi:retinol dehydrogenase-12
MDLRGRRIVVTGANTGIGRATVEALAARGAALVVACRSEERARAVICAIPSASFVPLDLGDLGSVRACAASILEGGAIDVLVNNAGVGGTRGVTKDGFELHFGVNYLGHYLLTRLLEGAIRDRVVHVVSGSHRGVRALDLGSVQRKTGSAFGLREYAASKLCNLLFHHELARRGVRSYAADPGDVASDGWRHVPWPIRPLMKLRMKTSAEGAQTSVWCATEPALPSGAYAERRVDEPSALSRDPALARELWARSAAWVGLAP